MLNLAFGALTFPLKDRLEPLASKFADKDIVFGIRPEHITNEPKERSTIGATISRRIAETVAKLS